MKDDSVVIVDKVSKDFKYTSSRANTLKSLFTGLVKKEAKERSIQHALTDISFDVKRGEFFGIVGRNGSGKSTLLKMLAGIYQPNKGKVRVHGKLVPFIELGVGFNPELTGRENVYLNGALLNFSKKEVDAFYSEVVEFAELEDFMDKKLKNYSSGMQVRLAFSMAIRAQADILLIDEVLAVGDADFQRKCFDYFTKLKGTETTVIFVSHDMEAVRQYCDKVMLIDEGRVKLISSAEEAAEEYLKLFSQISANTEMQNSKRWGDNSVKLGAGIMRLGKDYIEIETRLTAAAKVKDLVIGISVENLAGTIICGTNTQIIGQKLPALSKGEKTTVTWKIPNMFNDGRYNVTLAAHGYGGLPVYDWWHGAVVFETQYNRKTPYAFSPDIQIQIDK